MLVHTSTSASPRRNAEHALLERLLVHLTVRDLEAQLGAQRAQPLGGLVDRLDSVVEEERLALAGVLAHERLLDELLVVLADVGLDRTAALRRGLDHADVPHAGERHLQRPRDRRGAHRDDVDPELELTQQLLLLDTEALLLVDDQQSEVLGADVAAEQPVRADQDVDLALRESGDGLTLLGGGTEARHVLDRHRIVLQPLGERPVVLLGEDRRRHEQRSPACRPGRT